MDNRIKVAITEGDVNGIGYEVILKTFENEEMFDFCIPIIYGSPKVATYHKKAIESPTNFTIVNSAAEARPDCLNLVNCNEEDVKVEFGVVSPESGKAACQALAKAVEEYRNGLFDVLVTAPICKESIQSDAFRFPGHTEFLESKLGDGHHALMILMTEAIKVALVTVHEPISKVASLVKKELIEEKLQILNASLKKDFGKEIPRIAVLALNPHAGDGGLLGSEEQNEIIPAIKAMQEQGINCFGPFSSDGFFGSNDCAKFDAVLAMYHDQGLIPFKAMAMDEGVNYTAGLPIIRTSPDHGTAFDIAGKGVANEESFRQAVYTAIDICRSRRHENAIRRNPLRKQYFDRRDDSDKLKLDTPED